MKLEIVEVSLTTNNPTFHFYFLIHVVATMDN